MVPYLSQHAAFLVARAAHPSLTGPASLHLHSATASGAPFAYLANQRWVSRLGVAALCAPGSAHTEYAPLLKLHGEERRHLQRCIDQQAYSEDSLICMGLGLPAPNHGARRVRVALFAMASVAAGYPFAV